MGLGVKMVNPTKKFKVRGGNIQKEVGISSPYLKVEDWNNDTHIKSLYWFDRNIYFFHPFITIPILLPKFI